VLEARLAEITAMWPDHIVALGAPVDRLRLEKCFLNWAVFQQGLICLLNKGIRGNTRRASGRVSPPPAQKERCLEFSSGLLPRCREQNRGSVKAMRVHRAGAVVVPLANLLDWPMFPLARDVDHGKPSGICF